jgi:hypothetical protein
MRKELIKHADWNIVVVDWAGGSLPLYTQATANTRLVGLELAYLINYLQVMQLRFNVINWVHVLSLRRIWHVCFMSLYLRNPGSFIIKLV